MQNIANTPARFKGVVFDLDGTLVDSAPDLCAAANRMLAGLGAPALSLDQVISFIGNGVPKLVERCLAARALPAACQTEALGAFSRFYAADLATLTRPYSGVTDMLEKLQGARIKMAVCTNKPESAARRLCSIMGLSQFMAAIVGGDTLSVRKPEAAPLLHVIQMLELTTQDVLYVGDSETDYLTARAANVRFAFFSGGYQKAVIDDFAPDWRLNRINDVIGLLR
ncbi:MAG: phosphoglycolate phosphatase [Halocynthiibacter sp.]